MKELGRTFTIFFVSIFVFTVLCLFVQNNIYQETGQAVSSTLENSVIPTVNISYSNFEQELSKNNMVKDLPKNSRILLQFYNFDFGERLFEKDYIIQKTGVKETTNSKENVDIVLSIHSKYLKGLTNKNFCEIIKKANENGDLGFETRLSGISLAWKFRSMYKYRGCLEF